METKHVNHESPALPNISVNSNLTNDLVLTPSMASTRALLEDVCNDFENINVIAPKDNKFVYIKKWNLPGEYSQFTTEACNLMENIGIKKDHENEVLTSNTTTHQNDTVKKSLFNDNSISSTTTASKESQNQNFTGIVKTVDGSSLTTSVILPPAELQNQNCDGITNSVENARTEMVPLQDSSNKSVVPDTLAKDENMSSSLAELADAEIVRTGENAVSIIISNPRFIQVVTSANNSDIPSNISDLALNSNSIISEKESLTEVIVESTPVSEYSVQETNINKNNQDAANTIIYAHNLEEDISQRVNLPKYTSTPNTFVSKERNKMYVRSRAELGKLTKTRRITAKMKVEWAKELQKKGVLACPMSGCFQKYRSMATFQTHYKHCCFGMEKDLKHCPYCASVIFSSHNAVLHHMEVEHPERVEEYKANFPQPQDVPKNVSISDSNSSRFFENSQKSVTMYRKQSYLSKKNQLSPKRRLLKHKIKTMNESILENSKFKECGRFDEIVSKISSVSETETSSVDENKFSKERKKKKLILTGNVVAAEKYFEDEREVEISPNTELPPGEKINTKSKLVLNMDRYKRYSQYLTVTRDWASHRRTYSKPKSSDNTLDSSHSTIVQNDPNEMDIHQLINCLDSSNISLNKNDTFCLPDDKDLSTEVLNFDPLESEINILNKSKRNSLKSNEMDSGKNNEIETNSETTQTSVVQERIPCYMNQKNTLPSVKTPTIRRQKTRIIPIIYGKVPVSLLNKSDEKSPPAIDFDSLIKNSVSANKVNSIPLKKTSPNILEKTKYNKEDGVKHPSNVESIIIPPKRKRGRPPRLAEKPKICESEAEKQPNLKNKISQSSNKLVANIKRGRNVYKNKKATHISKYRRRVKKSKGAVKKLSSKIHFNLSHGARLRLSAQYSLKKAIMCGVKRNIKQNTVIRRRRRRRNKSHISFKGCFKNNKESKQVEDKLPVNIYDTNCDVFLLQIENRNENQLNQSENQVNQSENQVNQSENQVDQSEEQVNQSKEQVNQNQEQVKSDEQVNQNENKNLANLIQHNVEEQKHKFASKSSIAEESLVTSSRKITASTVQEMTSSPLQCCESVIQTQDISMSDPPESISSRVEQPNNISKSYPKTSDIESLNASKYEDKSLSETSSPVVVKRSRGRPRKSNTPVSGQTNPLAPTSTESSANLSVRKSERVRKRKFIDFEGEMEINTTKPSPEKTIKTGKRGRPRKYPKLEENIPVKQSEPDPLHSVIKSEEINASPGPTYSRRGRPRKNLSLKHLDNDSKTVELHNITKNLQELKKLEESPEKDITISSHLQAQEKKKGLILPLKKRKQIGELEDSCENGNGETLMKQTLKRKITCDDGSHNKKASSVSGITLQGTISSKKKESLNFVSDVENLCDYHEDIYPALKPDLDNFQILPSQYKKCLQASIHVKIDNSLKWTKLKCFDSISLDESNIATFFTGGPIQSSAFCPTPKHMLVNQYIAVASSNLLYNSHLLYDGHSYMNTKNVRGFIQFWNLGCLHNSTKLNQLPVMELALFHTYGIITQMKWCPKGCYDDPSKKYSLPRLGLLALSSSDSYVRIYSVPQPNFLPEADTVKKPIYYSNPSVILTPLFGEPCSVTGKSIATCIEWHKNGEQIAAGFGNGTICIWMLKPSANIMTSYVDKCLTLQPYMIFQAGGTPVTSVSFAPLKECRWLVSSSLDKTLKFFDLHDPCMPFCSLKRGFARNCEWAKKFCGAYVSLQDGVNCKGTCLAKECGTEEIASQNISNSINCLTFSAISEVINAQAIVDMIGTVTVNLMRNSYEQLKLPCYKNFIIFKTEVMALTENKEIIDTEVSNVMNSIEDVIDVMEKLTELKIDIFKNISLPESALLLSTESTKQVDNHKQDVADVMKDLLNCVSVHNFNTKSMLSLEKLCREQKIDEKGISLSCVPSDNSFQNYLSAEKKIFKEIKTLLNSVLCCVNNSGPTISTSKNPVKSAYDADLNSSVKENSSNKHSVESKQHLVESDTSFSDVLHHSEKPNFSKDSMLSECSYESASCDSSQSYLSASLIPHKSSESLIPHCEEETFILPVSSSMIVNKASSVSELNSVTLSKTYLNQSHYEKSVSNVESTLIANEKLSSDKTLNYSPNSQNEFFIENCISNDENNLKPVNPPKKLKTSDVNLNVSKTDSEFQESLNSSSKESSIVVKPVPTLESECPKESKKSQFSCQTTLLPRSCRPFIQVYNSTNETKKLENLNSQNKNTEHVHENMDKSDNNDIEDILIESPSYATLAKTYGLIFKDNSPEILSSEEKHDSLPIENTTLSALNTVSWNPNHGCHLWMCTAGNSGVARLICVSELSMQENTSLSN